MRVKSPWRRAVAMAVGLVLAGLSSEHATAKQTATHGATLRASDAVAGPLPSSSAESRIRALARSSRPLAAMELAELSRSVEVQGRARALLLAVRALAGLAEHEAAEKALIHHLRAPSAGNEPGRRHLARAVAALGLAATANPEGLRTLVLLASGPDDVDTELRALSRAALLAHPPDEAELEAAFPWQDDAARRTRVAWIIEQRTRENERRSERCQRARAGLDELHALPTSTAAALLSDLAECPRGAEPTHEDWQLALRANRTWALRGLAAVGPTSRPREWQALAESALAQGDTTTRSAAAWFLSVTSATTAAQLSRDRRPEVRAAAKNQLEANVSRLDARGDCAGLVPEGSTKGLFQRYIEAPSTDGDPILGCLASRLRGAPGPGFTSAELEVLFEAGPAVTRSVVAHGLGAARAEARTLARGLAERLYSLESDDHVRRALCGALVRLGLLAQDRLAREMATLDPDPVCRALGAGRPSTLRGMPYVTAATSDVKYVAARVLAPPLELEPAPDGFIGARVLHASAEATFDANFVDCRESGEPTWACGAAAPRPR